MFVRLAKKNLEQGSIVNGEGVRAVIWAQGCSHNCKGCHNPETHSFGGGYLVDVDNLKKEISSLKLHDGVTLSGGDPMFQVEQFSEIAEYSKSLGLNVWCYTGFTFETLLKKAQKDEYLKKLLKNIDVLVDGKFILEQRSLNLYYKGSRNQRVLDLQKSLKIGEPYEIEKYRGEKCFKTYHKEDKEQFEMFI